jgi:hypothetical protein
VSEEIRELLDAADSAQSCAYDEVVRLCAGGRWTMRVPVDQERDSDTVLVAALETVPKLTAALRAVLALADADDERAHICRVAAMRAKTIGEEHYYEEIAEVAKQSRNRIRTALTAALADDPTPVR